MKEKISEVTEFRAIGERLGTAGQPTESQFRDIKAAGFEAVINLALPTSDNALANEGSIVTGLGMIYAHIPVNFQGPSKSDFRAFCGMMEALGNKRVFIHCAANKRVSVFLFLYRVIRRGVPMAEAESDLRVVWNPDDVWQRFIDEQLARKPH